MNENPNKYNKNTNLTLKTTDERIFNIKETIITLTISFAYFNI